MALKIVWTPQAERGLENVIEYLEEKWTIKEIHNLEQNLQDFLIRISKYPKIYPETGKYKNVIVKAVHRKLRQAISYTL